MKIIRLILFWGILISCAQHQKVDLQKVDFKIFEMQIPEKWSILETGGLDSFSGSILTDVGDTIKFDYGSYSYSFDEYVRVRPPEMKSRYDSSETFWETVIYSKDYQLDDAHAVYLKNYYYYDTIDGYKTKFSLPKKIGLGTTGIYVDSIGIKGMKFCILGTNLDTVSHNQLFEAIKSIDFRD